MVQGSGQQLIAAAGPAVLVEARHGGVEAETPEQPCAEHNAGTTLSPRRRRPTASPPLRVVA